MEYTDSENNTYTNIKMFAKNIIDILGFTQNKLYKKEVEFITDKLVRWLEWDKPHGPYSNEMLAACIVKAIFDYYNVVYDDADLVDIHSLDEGLFFNLYDICEEWLYIKYWK